MGKNIPDILLYFRDKNSSDIIKAAFSRLMPPEPDDFLYLDWDSRIHLKHYSVLVDEQNYISSNYSVEEIEEYVVDFETSLKKYAEGFKNGYFDFKTYLDEKIENDYMGKESMDVVFKLIYDISFTQPYPISRIGDNIASVEKDLFEFGINSGYLYKAWEIIFKNQDVFEPMFKEPVKPPPKKKEVTPFVNCLKHDYPDKLAQMLKDDFTELKRPKQVALFILGLVELKLLKTETIKRSELLKSIENYFEINSFKPSALNKYLNYKFKNDNVDRHIDNKEINKTAERIVLIKNRLL